MASIDLTIQNVSIQPGGEVPWLKITGMYKYNFEQPMYLHGGYASLLIHSTRFPVIPLTSNFLYRQIEKNGNNSFDLEFPIDPNIIHRIELSRTETTLDLSIGMQIIGQRINDKIMEQVYANLTTPYTIKTKQWMSILESLGLNKRWNITIINPTGSLAPAIEGSELYFKAAYEALISGRYDDVLVNCRKVLENLWTITGDKTLSSGTWPKNGKLLPAIGTILDESHQSQDQDPPYSEKFYHYIEATYKLTHHGAHAGYIVSRSNAELCYSSAALILQVMCIAICKIKE